MATTTLPPAPAAPPAPPPGAGPRALRWTADEFDRLGASGCFEGRRPYLLDGVIWEQGDMGPTHANVVFLVHELLRPFFGAGWLVRNQLPLRADGFNTLFPDVAVVAGGFRDFFTTHPTTATLVVEVADTSLREDLTEKAERYATAGVADYWVLDLDGRRLLVLRDPQPLPKGLGATAYRTQTTHGPADRVAPLAAPAASVLVADLLP